MPAFRFSSFLCICMHIRCIYIYIYMYIYVCVYTYIYICLYIAAYAAYEVAFVSPRKALARCGCLCVYSGIRSV